MSPYHYHCDMASRYQQIAYYALYCMIPAIIYSRALITICYVIIAVMAILVQIRENRFSFNKYLAGLGLVGLSIVLSGINSDNIEQWWNHTVIKIPFLVMPLAFMILAPIPKEVIRNLHLILLVVLSISALPPLLDILQNHEVILDRISRGQPIDTPIEHVKYSMFLAYGIMSALIWTIYYRSELSTSQVKCFWIGGAFLFIMMHLLAVRTGLVILYASLIMLGVHVAWIRKIAFDKVATAMVVGLVSIFLLIQTPMIKSKLGYMFYDWEQYASNGGANYSDSERLFSLKTGWELFSENVLLGTGIGDLFDSCEEVYQRQSRSAIINYPHSQLIYQLAGTGLIGFILFIGGYLYPLIRRHNKFYFLLIALYLNYSLSFIVENSLERSMSVAFFVIFAAVLLSDSDGDTI